MSWAFSVNVLGFFEKRPLQSRPYETLDFALERANPTKSPPGGKNLSICRKNNHVIFFHPRPLRDLGWKNHMIVLSQILRFFPPGKEGNWVPKFRKTIDKMLKKCWKMLKKFWKKSGILSFVSNLNEWV